VKGVILRSVTIVAVATSLAAAAANDPEAVARDLNAGLLGVMKDSATLSYDARVERIGPIVDAAFDVPFMAEKSLGREWGKLDDAARTKWVALFREFMIANYAGRFTGYKGETFEQLGREDGAYDTVMVKTRLNVPSEENVDLDYRLRETPEGWRVVDIYLKGTVSELALRRSDYTAVVKRGGFDELSGYLRGKIDALKTGTAE
jgi:phospholipid transport system substrate-binding protein